MDGKGDAGDTLTDAQKLWQTVQEHVHNEEFEKAIQMCNSIRSKTPDDLDAIRVKCLCLINQDKYDKALQTASGKNKSFLAPERAYCLFQLKRHEEALELARTASRKNTFKGTRRGVALLHLEAQALYRLGRHGEAAEAYTRIAQEKDEEEQKGNKASGGTGASAGDGGLLSTVSVNLAAAYTAAGKSEEILEALPAEEVAEEEGVPWELLYNLGTALMQRGNEDDLANAERFLIRAEEACREALVEAGEAEEQVADEAAIVRSQLACAKGQAGRLAEAVEGLKHLLRSKPSDDTVSILTAFNLAALDGYKDHHEALKRLQSAMVEKSEKGLLPNQLKACRFTMCLLLLKCGKLEECRGELAKVRKFYPKSDVPSRIEAALLSKEGNSMEATSLMKARLKEADPGSQEEVALKLAICQLYASRGELASAAGTLRGVEAMKGTPGAAAALARLYAEMGDREAAASVVEEAAEAAWRGDHGLEGETKACALLGIADWLQNAELYPQAAEAYSKVLDLGAELDGDVRVQAQASLVIAYSYFDSERAEEEARKLPYDGDFGSVEGLDPAKLEMMELPGSNRARKLMLVDKAVVKAERKQKNSNPEAVLRKRAKKREKYIAKLISEGKIDPSKPTPKPDPERWIPRSHRSYGKRGRKRNKFVGAQGSGDGAAKDAAKLDAHARVQAKQEASTREQVVLPPGVGSKRAGKRR